MLQGRAKIIFSMLIWGSVGVFARYSELDGLKLAFYRVLLGSILLILIHLLKNAGWVKGAFLNVRPKIGLVFLLGFVLALNWVFFFSAIMYTNIAKATLIYYLAPIIVVILSSVFLKENITKIRIVLVCLAFLGAFLIGSQTEMSLGNKDFVGILFAFLGAIFYASVTILGRYLRDIDSSNLTFFQLFFATLILFPVLVSVGDFYVSLNSFIVVTFIAIIHTVFALFIYMDGLKEVEANEAALLSYLDPLSAIVYAAILLGEIPTFRTVIGGSLILVASFLDMKMK
ncbi:DMT family transporter [Thermococcus argininiproducens]|uniref:DMT family transporter n=1 Tax=Thermococcus argininiproducens TaxID=2866384 RepID=A0A9E7SCX2_9EURY|nr:DMT family transporter [Thermococcus argininiproducens]USH00205.1 DMT family transporter [Thermococcus argininiproducens]